MQEREKIRVRTREQIVKPGSVIHGVFMRGPDIEVPLVGPSSSVSESKSPLTQRMIEINRPKPVRSRQT